MKIGKLLVGILYIMFLLLVGIPVYSFYSEQTTTFSDSSSIKNISFIDGSNIIDFVSVLHRSYINNFSLLVSGVYNTTSTITIEKENQSSTEDKLGNSLDNPSWCYDESYATACGIQATDATSTDSQAYVYENYTISGKELAFNWTYRISGSWDDIDCLMHNVLSCYNDSNEWETLAIHFRVGDGTLLNGNVLLPDSCTNITKGIIQIRHFMRASSVSYYCNAVTNYYYDGAMITINKDYPINISLNIGEFTWDYYGEYSISNNISVNNTLINNILFDCNCSNCTKNSNYCSLPLNFSSDSTGILQIENIKINSSYDLNNCSASIIPQNATALNFTIYDENNLTSLSADVDGTFNFLYYNYTLSLDDVDNFKICIYPDYAEFDITSYIQYESTNGFRERYYLENLTINNNTQNIYLYNFDDNTGVSELTALLYNYHYDLYPNVITKLQRYYSGENLWRTVQIDKSDELGKALFYVYQNYVDYKIIFEQDGVMLDQTVPLKFICDSDTECEQSFRVEPSNIETDWSGFSYTVSYNNVTNIWVLTWSDSKNVVDNVQFVVQQLRSNRINNICDTNLSAVSGTLICNSSGYTGVLQAKAYRSASPSTPFYQSLIEIITDKIDEILKSSGYTKAGDFFGFMIALAVIGFGLVDLIAVIISAIIGIIAIYLLGISSWFTYTFIIGGLFVGILVAYIIKK